MKVWPGEDLAWNILEKLDPNDVQTNASVTFNSELSFYLLECFGQTVYISLRNKNIYSDTFIGKLLIDKLGEYSRLSILKYLTLAKDVPFSGKLVKPSDMPGGGIFLQGTHVLPLDKIAEWVENNRSEFLEKCKKLQGAQLDYGDISIKLFPFSRVQIVLILWMGDEEFPTNASLLLDSSSTLHIPTDIIWSIAMMTLELLFLI